MIKTHGDVYVAHIRPFEILQTYKGLCGIVPY